MARASSSDRSARTASSRTARRAPSRSARKLHREQRHEKGHEQLHRHETRHGQIHREQLPRKVGTNNSTMTVGTTSFTTNGTDSYITTNVIPKGTISPGTTDTTNFILKLRTNNSIPHGMNNFITIGKHGPTKNI
ncbi:unnamed protein product [Prorocentrum cordatum]|uniref:Uncharacterized protein n=1 Tax=Prorocentrum cordatum TaxID=2364126 RepID=A0ABN9UPM3_9DINO|nr:unnamed protein product [Polarella glacialis]